MAKHRSHNRRRGNVWEVYWFDGKRNYLVQETSYDQVIKRMERLALYPWITRSGYRQVAGKPVGR